MSHSTKCAACKSLRRRCCKDCVLAPYFPPTNPQRFSRVHKVFGASNITKMLEQLPLHLRAVAADCMSFEASSRVEDPVYGSVGIISQLQEQIIKAESELAKTKSEIAFHNAQQLQQQQNESSSCKIEELHDTDEATTNSTVKPVSSKNSK
uniref:LOB domain-containing protein n=1 Tax=Quercus lobata TaxID=97700 RepID=A0A7N2LV74_QUELO